MHTSPNLGLQVPDSDNDPFDELVYGNALDTIDAQLGIMRRGELFVARASNLSLATGVLTAIPWDVEISDADGAHAAGASAITLPVSGQYLVILQAAIDTGAGDRLLRIDVGASVLGYAVSAPPSGGSGAPWAATLAKPYNGTAGDAIVANAYQNSGAALNLLGNVTSLLLWRFR